MEQLTSQMDGARQERDSMARELEDARIKQAGLKQQVDFVMENIRRVRQEIRRLEEELSGLESGTGESGRIIEEKRRQIE